MLRRLIQNLFSTHPGAKENQVSNSDNSIESALQSARQLLEGGNPSEALVFLQALDRSHPPHPELLVLLANVAAELENIILAQQYLERAAYCSGASSELIASAAAQFTAYNATETALRILQHGLHIHPTHGHLHNQLGLVKLTANNLKGAEVCFKKVLELDSLVPDALNNLGIIAQRRNDFTTAFDFFKRATVSAPHFSSAHSNLGLTLRELQRPDEALIYLRRAVSLAPNNAACHLNLGTLLTDMGQLDEADAHLARATALDPKMTDALVAQGVARFRAGKYAEAKHLINEMLTLAPSNPEAHATLGEIQLAEGRFGEGWANYEYRLQSKESPSCSYPYSIWGGEDLTGKTVLVYGEQGLGDTIMFASCVQDILSRADGVILVCSQRLHSLFSRSFRTAVVYPQTTPSETPHPNESIDGYTAIGSLPRHYRRRIEDFPGTPFLIPDAARAEYWRARLDALGTGPKVGISWRGGLVKTGKLARSLALEEWMPLLRKNGMHYVSLQYDDCEQELVALHEQGITVHHWHEAIKDLDESAALITELDLVITVCNTTVHLAGAIGTPVWVLVPANPAWRYFVSGERLPWYASARLFRQSHIGTGWADVMDRLTHALDTHFPTENH